MANCNTEESSRKRQENKTMTKNTKQVHELEKKAMKKRMIFVTVAGGVTSVCEDTVPEGFEVEIIDFDNINAGDAYPSREAAEYAVSKGWYKR